MKEAVASEEMCFYCFDVIYHLLDDRPLPEANFTNDSFPVFVTWKFKDNDQLRGCVGTKSSLGLHAGVKEYARISAFEDPRFSAITLEELPKLKVTVSLLHKFEDAKDHLDWTIGLHGLWISFSNEQGGISVATYLPDFAEAQGPDRVKTVDALLRKGGFKGTITKEFRDSVKVTRYETSRATATYDDYKVARSLE